MNWITKILQSKSCSRLNLHWSTLRPWRMIILQLNSSSAINWWGRWKELLRCMFLGWIKTLMIFRKSKEIVSWPRSETISLSWDSTLINCKVNLKKKPHSLYFSARNQKISNLYSLKSRRTWDTPSWISSHSYLTVYLFNMLLKNRKISSTTYMRDKKDWVSASWLCPTTLSSRTTACF